MGLLPRPRTTALCLTLTALWPVPSAFAHAPPQVLRIVWKNERELVLVTNRGLMFGDLERKSFRLMCGEALHLNVGEQPQIAYRADGTLLAATSYGLFVANDDKGCGWTPVAPLTDLFVPTLTQLSTGPDVLVASTFGKDQSAIWLTRDGGRTWSTLSALSGEDYTRSLLAAPQDSSRLYATGTQLIRTPMTAQVQYVARSRDGGQTWERTEHTLQEGELSLTLLAVHPTQNDVLLVRADSASPGLVSERLLVSSDGGRTFRTGLTALSVAAAAFAEDGSAAWAAGNEGLWKSGTGLDDFQRVGSAEHLSCVEQTHGRLWACGHYAGSKALLDGVGSAPIDAAAFDPFLDFTEVTALVDCDADSVTSKMCALPWQDYQVEVLLGAAMADGGGPDAGYVNAPAEAGADAGSSMSTGDAAREPSPRRDASGCAISANARAGQRGFAWFLSLIASLALGRRHHVARARQRALRRRSRDHYRQE